VIIRQAQQHHNVVAASLVRAHTTLNLIRYHGALEYMRLHHNLFTIDPRSRLGRLLWSDASLLQNETPSSSGIVSTGNASISSAGIIKSGVSKASVAFMITSSQKKELQERLGYTVEDIKSMKPAEASFILQHEIENSSNFLQRVQQLMENSSNKNSDETVPKPVDIEPSALKNQREEAPMQALTLIPEAKLSQSASPHNTTSALITLGPNDRHKMGGTTLENKIIE